MLCWSRRFRSSYWSPLVVAMAAPMRACSGADARATPTEATVSLLLAGQRVHYSIWRSRGPACLVCWSSIVMPGGCDGDQQVARPPAATGRCWLSSSLYLPMQRPLRLASNYLYNLPILFIYSFIIKAHNKRVCMVTTEQ